MSNQRTVLVRQARSALFDILEEKSEIAKPAGRPPRKAQCQSSLVPPFITRGAKKSLAGYRDRLDPRGHRGDEPAMVNRLITVDPFSFWSVCPARDL
jgi:hypothetical protein